MQKTHIPEKHYEALKIIASKMKNTGDFNGETLRRKIRKHCKTHRYKNHYYIALRSSRHYIYSPPPLYFSVYSNPFSSDCRYVAYLRHPDLVDIHYTFHFSDNKELMRKIISHNLLIKLPIKKNL
ncbi:MAG: hypothetical protein RBR78_08710 [Flavobacteriaceae bacterium]|jgi:hypothetical protein|nr:hypothetical protein [Flavobacteriaceae bacterium]